ncbi:phosphoribosylglycinamide formyltransferase [Marinicella sediminis]|uniref:Phosphoribosylglycinamide formyltransferase n=1 Tax=Marinicella sediminis TaxID=1792834 RepID=A0ABV7JAH3_9GAMM|nr:phosphoribosylglycinamide formyltransferase [Marinicella sediminis]
MKVVVLISGRGSNLEALLQDQSGYQITHVISNNPTAKGLEIAHHYGVTNSYLDWTDRQKAEQFLLDISGQEQADLVILAGFMKILSAELVDRLFPKIINIHPSLLPDYPGLNTHQRVLEDQRDWHGATVHLVDSQLDHGPRISQTTIPVTAADNATSLAEKLLRKEHKLLTRTVGLMAQQQILWQDQQLMYKQQPLTKPLMMSCD